MFTGSVSFEARFTRHNLIFKTEYVPPDVASVDKVAIEGADEKKIQCTVFLSSIATQNEGGSIASKVCEEALDRIAFMHDVVIEVANETDHHFSRIDQQPGMVDVSARGRQSA